MKKGSQNQFLLGKDMKITKAEPKGLRLIIQVSKIVGIHVPKVKLSKKWHIALHIQDPEQSQSNAEMNPGKSVSICWNCCHHHLLHELGSPQPVLKILLWCIIHHNLIQPRVNQGRRSMILLGFTGLWIDRRHEAADELGEQRVRGIIRNWLADDVWWCFKVGVIIFFICVLVSCFLTWLRRRRRLSPRQ